MNENFQLKSKFQLDERTPWEIAQNMKLSKRMIFEFIIDECPFAKSMALKLEPFFLSAS